MHFALFHLLILSSFTHEEKYSCLQAKVSNYISSILNYI